MSSIKVKIADRIIRIDVEYFHVYRLCQDFFFDGAEDFAVSSADINLIQEEKMYSELCPGEDVRGYYIESQAILRKVAERLLEFDTIMMHGASIAYDNKCYIFSAPSGSGKTTHIRKWLDRLHDSFVVNGDKPFIKIDDSIMVCGSPWSGKEEMHTNTMVPLDSIIFMERAEKNHIEQISFAQAFPFLLQQVYRPDDEEKMRRTLRLVQRLSPTVNFFRFQFNNFKDDCFDVAYNTLVGESK